MCLFDQCSREIRKPGVVCIICIFPENFMSRFSRLTYIPRYTCVSVTKFDSHKYWMYNKSKSKRGRT